MFTDVNECNDDVCDANTNCTNTVKNIWKSYIWTADKDVNESDPRSNVHYLGRSGNKAWKKKKSLRDLYTWPLEAMAVTWMRIVPTLTTLMAPIAASVRKDTLEKESHAKVKLNYT